MDTNKELFAQIQDLVKFETAQKIILILIVFLVMMSALKLVQMLIHKFTKNRLTSQSSMIIGKIVRYTGFTLIALTIFNLAGLDISAILGAAGIAGIAIGFAAQTSVSNVISGIFLISESSFALKDVITVNSITGIVKSIDLLSVKIQTFDNKFIRIPNETLIKSEIINITRYPIRRMDIFITVRFSTDLDTFREALLKVARENHFALENPEPFILIESFDVNGFKILFGVWFAQDDFVSLKNSLMQGIKKAFDECGIDLAHQTVIVENMTAPRENARSRPKSTIQ